MSHVFSGRVWGVLLLLLLAACAATDTVPLPPTPLPFEVGESAETAPPQTPTEPLFDGVTVAVDVTQSTHPISPYVYGVSGGEDDLMAELQPPFTSWGGNPSTRYNWRLGNAWNSGSDYLYWNTNYGIPDGVDVALEFINEAQTLGQASRLAVPTLGWVAKDTFSCSFPEDNWCGIANGANCDYPYLIADPNLANVPSTTADIVEWLQGWLAQGYEPTFVAMDNEPELWGYTHFDVHPDCTTYQEMLDKYLAYATALRPILPTAQLTGPNTCCWHFYWNSPAGTADKLLHGNRDFLPWFLTQVRRHDEQVGQRHLDVLDVHYYPEGLYNGEVDDATAAWRLRSTRSLWDDSYKDESWINKPVALIPTLKEVIDDNYPGTKLGISEWNWGADDTMNGALAIADVLGIFGREDVYFAAYWQFPQPQTPGYYAFKLYTNVDDQGQRFGDTSVAAQSDAVDRVSGYAALDSATGNLHVMLVNKRPTQAENVRVALNGFTPQPTARLFRLEQAQPDNIVATSTDVTPDEWLLTLPPYSISHFILEAQG
jgi:hypothetical protein